MTASYTFGTVTVTQGSTTVTGNGTGWLTANISPGYFGTDTVGSIPLPVLEVVSDTELTLVTPWRGESASGAPYWLSYDTRDGQQTVNNAQRLAEYIARLDRSALKAIAAIDPVDQSLPIFTGSNSAALVSLSYLLSRLNHTGQLPESAIGENLPPNKAFRRGNIINVVSQSSGVPTGGLIERGSNGNGEYVRYADGTQMTWGLQSFNASVTAGQTFQPGIVQPAAFVGTAKTFVQASFYTGVNGAGFALYAVKFGSSFTNNSSSYGELIMNLGKSPSNALPDFSIGSTAAASLLVNYFTIGRWF